MLWSLVLMNTSQNSEHIPKPSLALKPCDLEFESCLFWLLQEISAGCLTSLCPGVLTWVPCPYISTTYKNAVKITREWSTVPDT